MSDKTKRFLRSLQPSMLSSLKNWNKAVSCLLTLFRSQGGLCIGQMFYSCSFCHEKAVGFHDVFRLDGVGQNSYRGHLPVQLRGHLNKRIGGSIQCFHLIGWKFNISLSNGEKLASFNETPLLLAGVGALEGLDHPPVSNTSLPLELRKGRILSSHFGLNEPASKDGFS